MRHLNSYWVCFAVMVTVPLLLCSGCGDPPPDTCTPQMCDDGQECTSNVCANNQCSNPPVANGTSCDGGNGSCRDGTCEPADPACIGKDCSDGDECTSDVCTNGNCSNPPGANGTSCGGGTGTCQDGVCQPDEPCAGIDCADQNQCTDDATCNPDNGQCEGGGFEPVDTACDQDEGSFCNDAGVCVECNQSAQCDHDGNACTAPTCNAGSCATVNVEGSCNYMGQAGICDDGDCIDAFLCDPDPCQDRGPCVVDKCNTATGACTYNNAPNGALCGAVAHVCVEGVCVDDSLSHLTYTGTKSDLAYGQYAVLFSAGALWGHAGFYFNFLGSGVDHEIDRISSGFFLAQPAQTVVLAASAVYWDQNADDDYSWRFNTQELPIGSTRHLASGSSGGGTIDRNLGALVPGQVPVLLGFGVNRTTDYHLERISVQLYGGTSLRLVVRYQDESPGENYTYSVYYALVPSNRVRTTGSSGRSSVREKDTQAISAQRPILQGFDFRFLNGDHHIDRFGARLDPGVVYVWFNDHNNDDSFSWQVRWADLQ